MTKSSGTILDGDSRPEGRGAGTAPRNCAEVGRWIDALLDGELDSKNDAEVREHLEGCAACKRRYEAKEALSANMRRLELGYTAPESLRARIAAALDAEAAGEAGALGAAGAGTPATTMAAAQRARAPAPSAGDAANATARAAAHAAANVVPLTASPPQAARRTPGRWFALAGWPVALAASAMLATVLLQQRAQIADDIVSAHVRSLQVDHLSDVISSSHHTVKPWFAGKIDFSPPVPDLSPLGFELVGGRLDYVEHRAAAALVYRKHGHIINVLVSRDGANVPQTARVQGYSLRSWKQSGLTFVAVSDIDPLELDNLQQGFESPPQPSPEPPDSGSMPSR
jgi:mycothiol system anti-sigma-R factor